MLGRKRVSFIESAGELEGGRGLDVSRTILQVFEKVRDVYMMTRSGVAGRDEPFPGAQVGQLSVLDVFS
jgi:hypothetical protein